jgi:hypothetical protein
VGTEVPARCVHEVTRPFRHKRFDDRDRDDLILQALAVRVDVTGRELPCFRKSGGTDDRLPASSLRR